MRRFVRVYCKGVSERMYFQGCVSERMYARVCARGHMH